MAENKGKVENEKNNASIVFVLLESIGTLGLLIAFFIGILYTMRGNILTSVIFSLLFVLILRGIPVILKKRKIKKEINKSNVIEYILLMVYSIFGIMIFPIMFHFIDIDFNRKDDLKTIGLDKVEAVRKVKENYNKLKEMEVEAFESDCEELVSDNRRGQSNKDKLEERFGSGTLSFNWSGRITNSAGQVNKIVEDRCDDLDTELLIEDQLNIELFYDENVIHAQSVFENWQLLKVSHTYYELNSLFAESERIANEKLSAFIYTKPTLDLSLPDQDFGLEQPIVSLMNSTPTNVMIAFVLVLLMYLFVLSEYLFAGRVKIQHQIDSPVDNLGIKIKS